jgi:hypothetical protein
MGLGTGLFLVAVGAILRFAVNVQSNEFDWHTVGLILMIVGGIGILLSLLFWESWGGVHRRRVVEDGPGRRRVVDEY